MLKEGEKVFKRITRRKEMVFSLEQKRERLIVISTLIAYLVAFMPLYRAVGISAYATTFIPVVLAGWLIGLRPAVFVSFVLFFINAGLAFAIGYSPPGAFASSVPGLFLMLIFGTVIGRLRDLSVSLRHEIAQRKIAEEEIKKRSYQLEHSNQLKDLYTDIMRHDLLNSVTVIGGVTNLLIEEAPTHIEDLAVIKKNAEKLAGMIDGASKLAKLESAAKLEKTSLNLKQLVGEAAENCRFLLDSAGMKVENRIEDNLLIQGNSILEDVFINLISNAAKYANEGKELVIEAEEDDKSIRIAVKDQGAGIPDEFKKDIFKRFIKREKSGVKGFGLGLAIANRVVELHNGKIWMEDNIPRGSVFYVLLPKEG